MPAPNDLTPEEQQLFGAGGLPDLGPGREPVDDGQQQADDGQQQGQQQADDQQQQQTPRRPNGQFKSREELEAEAAQTGQQQGGEQQGQQQERKMVPLEALHEARQRAASALQQAQTLSVRMNALLAAQQQQGQQPPAMPNMDDDPAGYIKALEGRVQKFEQQWSQTNEERQIDQALTQDEQLFSATQPDYDQASDYYVQSRARELLQFHPPQEAQQIMLAEAREIAKQSWQRGQSPAQTVYNTAIARGYQAGQSGQQPSGQQQRGPNPADQVRAITNGQQASRSLSGGGSGASQTLNAEAILSMTDDEFEKYLALGQKGANDRFAQIA